MVLRPIGSGEVKPEQGCVPVWDAILPTQKISAPEYWLVTQPDHAALSGALVAALGPPLLPRVSAEAVQGIGQHDDGWAPLDAQVPLANGKPLSFLDFLPRDFLLAWNRSIESAEKLSPLAGVIVSGHFRRLGKNRLESRIDDAEDRKLLLEFLAREQTRQQRLRAGRSQEEFEFLTDVLQFCDVLSLYLCSGAMRNVEFSQKFGSQPIRVWREAAPSLDQGTVYRFEPSPFAAGGVHLAVSARRYPLDRHPNTVMLPFLLW